MWTGVADGEECVLWTGVVDDRGCVWTGVVEEDWGCIEPTQLAFDKKAPHKHSAKTVHSASELQCSAQLRENLILCPKSAD